MVCFILDRKTFTPLTQWDILEYNTMIDSVYDNTGSITVLGNVDYGNEGNFLTFNGNIWVISAVSPTDEQTRLTLLSVISAFDRDLIYTAGQNAAQRIVGAFTSEYKNLSDPEYAMPFLNITDTHTSASTMQPDVEDGLWSLKSFIRKVRRLTTLHVDFSLGAGALNVSIYDAQTPLHTVVFGDGHHLLQSSTYSKDSVAKITAIQGSTYSNWYLAEDGTISTTIPANRAKGEWKTIIVGDDDDVAEEVAGEFAENSTSHKIEFWSDKRYNLNDNIRLLVNGSVVTSYIAYVGIRSTDDRYYYKSGELATTLVEKIQRVEESSSSFVTSQEAAAAAPVQSVNGQTGNPHGLIYKGTTSALNITDLDTLYDPGIYYMNSDGIANAPSGYKWSFLFVVATDSHGSGLVIQEIRKDGATDSHNNFKRRWSGNPLYWTAWQADVLSVNGQTGAVVIEPTYDAASSAASLSVSSSTATTLQSVSLSPGKYMVSFGAVFASNATGYRAVAISTTTSMSNAGYPAMNRVPSVSGVSAWISCTTPLNITATTTIYFLVYQNSGSALNVSGNYRILKFA